MWYVSDIQLIRFDGVEVPQYCLEITQTILDNSDVYVFLRNTKTEDEECLVDSVANAERFKQELDRYNPYGCVQIDSWTSPRRFVDSTRIMLIKVDDLSIQFLSYIDYTMPVKFGKDPWLDLFLYERVDRVTFQFWDRERTLVEFLETSCQCAGTLFHAARMLPNSWRDDVLYICTRLIDYGIHFNDAKKARSLISKAAMLNIDNHLEVAWSLLPINLPF